MIVTCPACRKQQTVDAAQFNDQTARVRCRCGELFSAFPSPPITDDPHPSDSSRAPMAEKANRYPVVVVLALLIFGAAVLMAVDPGGKESGEEAGKVPSAPAELSAVGSRWYEGGTLQNATVAQWQAASPADRLATASDWAVRVPGAKEKVMASGSIEALKPVAIELMQCVDEAAAGQVDKTTEAADLAASCVVQMGSGPPR